RQVTERRMTTRFQEIPGMEKPLTVVRGGFMVDGAAPVPAGPPPRLGAHMDDVFASLPARGKGRARA
ncbi:MAG: CoA transferase, partial [Mesorhizobium sp.]